MYVCMHAQHAEKKRNKFKMKSIQWQIPNWMDRRKEIVQFIKLAIITIEKNSRPIRKKRFDQIVRKSKQNRICFHRQKCDWTKLWIHCEFQMCLSLCVCLYVFFAKM